MLIILGLYLFLVWLVFSKLKLLKWGRGPGSVTVLVGAFILAVFWRCSTISLHQGA